MDRRTTDAHGQHDRRAEDAGTEVLMSSGTHPTHAPLFFFAATATATMAIVLGGARSAAAIDSKGELQCQIGTSQAVGKFIRAKTQCIDNCQKNAFANGETPDCSPPYDSGPLQGCVSAAEGQAGGDMQSTCAQDCPECYAGGDCQVDSDTRVADAEAHVDAFAAEAFCDDSASTDALTLSEFKCQRTVRKVVAHFAATKLKCFAKCRKAEVGGKIPPGSCTQPVSDAKTQECISRAEVKSAFLIDKKCESGVNPSADKPECAPYDSRTGAAWVAAEEAAVDAIAPSLFCDDATTTTTTTTLP
jgi:hypothetical protein